jgi:hypothetical protein
MTPHDSSSMLEEFEQFQPQIVDFEKLAKDRLGWQKGPRVLYFGKIYSNEYGNRERSEAAVVRLNTCFSQTVELHCDRPCQAHVRQTSVHKSTRMCKTQGIASCLRVPE